MTRLFVGRWLTRWCTQPTQCAMPPLSSPKRAKHVQLCREDRTVVQLLTCKLIMYVWHGLKLFFYTSIQQALILWLLLGPGTHIDVSIFYYPCWIAQWLPHVRNLEKEESMLKIFSSIWNVCNMAAAPPCLGAVPCSVGTVSLPCSAPRSGDLCLPHFHSPQPRDRSPLAKHSADDLFRVSAAKHETHPNSIPPPRMYFIKLTLTYCCSAPPSPEAGQVLRALLAFRSILGHFGAILPRCAAPIAKAGSGGSALCSPAMETPLI